MSEQEARYRKDLIKAKARLYFLLTFFPEGELKDDSPELDMMYALSRDKDIQEILNKTLAGSSLVEKSTTSQNVNPATSRD